MAANRVYTPEEKLKIVLENNRMLDKVLHSTNSSGYDFPFSLKHLNFFIACMEGFFRSVRRNVRKRCGNIATGNIVTQSGESLALFQNMSNPECVKIVFGSEDIPALFARYRKPFKKPGMTRKKMLELVDAGTKMIMDYSLQDSPYSESMMQAAYASRSVE